MFEGNMDLARSDAFAALFDIIDTVDSGDIDPIRSEQIKNVENTLEEAVSELLPELTQLGILGVEVENKYLLSSAADSSVNASNSNIRIKDRITQISNIVLHFTYQDGHLAVVRVDGYQNTSDSSELASKEILIERILRALKPWEARPTQHFESPVVSAVQREGSGQFNWHEWQQKAKSKYEPAAEDEMRREDVLSSGFLLDGFPDLELDHVEGFNKDLETYEVNVVSEDEAEWEEDEESEDLSVVVLYVDKYQIFSPEKALKLKQMVTNAVLKAMKLHETQHVRFD